MTHPRPVSQPDTVGGRSERTGHPRGFRDPTRPEPQSGRRSRSTPSFQQLLGLSTHCPPGREPVTAAPPPTGLPRMQEATLPLPAAGGHCLPQPADHGTPHCDGRGAPGPGRQPLPSAGSCVSLRTRDPGRVSPEMPTAVSHGSPAGSLRTRGPARSVAASVSASAVPLHGQAGGRRPQSARGQRRGCWPLWQSRNQGFGCGRGRGRTRHAAGVRTAGLAVPHAGTRWHAASRGPTRPHAVSRGRTWSAVGARAVRTCVQGAVAAACVLAPGAQGSADLAPGGDAVPGWPRPSPRCAHHHPPPRHEETA